LANYLSKQVGGRKIGKFTVQPILNNIKTANWRIKLWQISSIRQIRRTKVLPNFCLLRYPTDCSIRVYRSMLFKQAYLCPTQPFMFCISIPSITGFGTELNSLLFSAIEFVPLTNEFVTLAIEFVHLANSSLWQLNSSLWHENSS